MTVGSDNVFPKVILAEGAAPATPSSGQVKVYAKADGLVYSKDDAGTETPLGGGGSGQAATVRRTAGDLATSSTSFVDATSLTITLTTAAHRCLVIFSGMAQKSTWTNVFVDIDVDGTRVGGSNGLTGATINNASAYDQNLSFSFLTDVLSAASHTIKVQWRVNGGSATLFASATTPAVLSVIELPF